MTQDEDIVRRLTKTKWTDVQNRRLQKIIGILDMTDDEFHEMFEQFD